MSEEVGHPSSVTCMSMELNFLSYIHIDTDHPSIKAYCRVFAFISDGRTTYSNSSLYSAAPDTKIGRSLINANTA